MPKVIYEMSMSADGHIAGPDGSFDWGGPSADQHRFHNDHAREIGGHLLGRKLYETMRYWETADDPSEISRDFAEIWLALPKVVFSRTLESAEGPNTTLARGDLRTEVEALMSATGGDVAIGGAGLAAEAARLGLIDEFRIFVYPVFTGGGTPYFPPGVSLDLELEETRTFDSRVVYLRYRAVRR